MGLYGKINCMNIFRADSISIKVNDNYILEDLSFSITEKEITLLFSYYDEAQAVLNALYLKNKVLKGKLYYGNEDLTSFNFNNREEWRISDIGYISYRDRLFENLTVFDNITMPVRLNRLTVQEEYIDELLDNLALEDIKNEYVKDISLVDRVKVLLARAMAARPFVLLLNDITKGLKQFEIDVIVDCLSHLNNLYHISIIHATNYQLLKNSASRVLTIQDGVIKDDKDSI